MNATMNTLAVNEIESVYSGINGKCCCGCAGKHYYASAHREAGSKSRGYEVSDDEVSDKMVAKVVGIINRADEIDDNGDHVATVVGRRLYVAYRGS